MINHGKKNILGVLVDAVDYESAVDRIIKAAISNNSFSTSALAVHGVMTGVHDSVHRYRLNTFDLLLPDGQPIRWALDILHKANLPDRVYGPTLMLKICERAAKENLSIYFYGSRQEVIDALASELRRKVSGLTIAGKQPSTYSKISPNEKLEVINMIKESGAAITFVGLGCPRQEVWVYEYRDYLSMPLIAVGAAFDFHAGFLSQAPPFLQNIGLEWFYRLLQEPKRLWKRYVFLNPEYLFLIFLQMINLKHFDPMSGIAPTQELGYG
ncbi:MAG: WecB/TagA/CpsF family glycosyltransferase [Anaerolineaceae bacterium]|nr:WecB/TagA/CpsF family glycosyltransferase [Anaerolineaceae bacterium]